jgi:hypothetical protein
MFENDVSDIRPRALQSTDSTSAFLYESNHSRQKVGSKNKEATMGKGNGASPDYLSFAAPIYPEQTTGAATSGDRSTKEAGEQKGRTIENQGEEKLPTHLKQTDTGTGTKDNPINNNCQNTTLKNLFNFYGMDSQAAKVNDWESQLLNNIRDQHGKGINSEAIACAFKNDKISPSEIKGAIKAGKLDGVFQGEVAIDGANTKGVVASDETGTLFLSEMGCKPEQQRLGTKEAADKVQAALDSGKPVLLADINTTTLLGKATERSGEPAPPPAQGHLSMAYKKNGQYYVSDPSCEVAVQVSPEVLKDKLMDANTSATIINAPPDPDKFLRH